MQASEMTLIGWSLTQFVEVHFQQDHDQYLFTIQVDLGQQHSKQSERGTTIAGALKHRKQKSFQALTKGSLQYLKKIRRTQNCLEFSKGGEIGCRKYPRDIDGEARPIIFQVSEIHLSSQWLEILMEQFKTIQVLVSDRQESRGQDFRKCLAL
jgi:hypothetical protein